MEGCRKEPPEGQQTLTGGVEGHRKEPREGQQTVTGGVGGCRKKPRARRVVFPRLGPKPNRGPEQNCDGTRIVSLVRPVPREGDILHN